MLLCVFRWRLFVNCVSEAPVVWCPWTVVTALRKWEPHFFRRIITKPSSGRWLAKHRNEYSKLEKDAALFPPLLYQTHLPGTLCVRRRRCWLSLWQLPSVSSASIRVQVEFYVNENTFKERLKLFFIKNQRSSKWNVKSHLQRPTHTLRRTRMNIDVNWCDHRNAAVMLELFHVFLPIRSSNPRVQLLSEAADVSAVHDPSGDRQPRPPRLRTAERSQWKMVCGQLQVKLVFCIKLLES